MFYHLLKQYTFIHCIQIRIFVDKGFLSITDINAYSELALRNNAAVVEYCRISMAALSGGTAGLLGLTGLYGFGFYIFAVIGLWVKLFSIF